MVRRQSEPFRWEGVELHPYKEDGGTHFRDISRQTLLLGTEAFPVELRYFEMQPGGYSTLERHEHVHVVTIGRGSGQVLVRDKVTAVSQNDVVLVPPLTWHQFRATDRVPFAFFCVVSSERDRPQRPTEADLDYLRSDPVVAEFVRV